MDTVQREPGAVAPLGPLVVARKQREKEGVKLSQKLESWMPQPPPDEDMCNALRQLVVEAVFAKHNAKHQNSTLTEIYDAVRQRVDQLRTVGRWPWKYTPSKRTVDRRVNEAADPRFYGGGAPKIVAVTAGVYAVNPVLFGEGSQK